MKPKIFSLSQQQTQAHYRASYARPNYLQKTFNADFITVNTGNYYSRLRHQLTELLLSKNIIAHPIPLEQLHQALSHDLKKYGNDGLGAVGTLLYENNHEFLSVLHEFIQEILFKKIIGKPFLFQATPTFRIHCPNAENSSFFPHYHTDLALGHPPHEINLWIPLTPPVADHGFFLASKNDSIVIADYINFDLASLMDDSVFRDEKYLEFCQGKFLPAAVPAGEALMFDGRCFHTAMPITTHTRISVDFRIVLEEDFLASDYIYQNCGRRKHLDLTPGEYYFTKGASEKNT